MTARRGFLLFFLLFLLWMGEWLVPGFSGSGQIANQLKIASFLGLFAIGQTLVMIAGGQGLDLSVGAVASLSATLGAAVLGAGAAGLVPTFVVAVACGALVGLVNGCGITLLRIPPLVMTLVMASVVHGGLIVWASAIRANIAATPALVGLAGRTLVGIPTVTLIWLVAVVLTWRVINHSVWGRSLMAVGANPTAALLSGVCVRTVRIAVYTASGIIAGVGGVLLLGYVGQAFLALGENHVLPSVVVAVIGGVSLSGGRGDYVAVAIAAVLLTVLTSLLTALQITEAGRQVIFGLTLLLFLALNRWSAKEKK